MTAFSPQAIIFDMDGLLVDSEPTWLEAENEILIAHGVVVADEVRRQLVGRRNDEYLGRIREIYNMQASFESLRDGVLERMLDLIPRHVKPRPGAVEILHYVQQRQIPVALASSSPVAVIEAIIHSQNWAGILPIRCSAEDEVQGKPAPDVYLKAAALLKIAPRQCLALEDSVNGARAAVAAGMTCYAVPDLSHTHIEAFQGVTEHVFDSLHSVLRKLTKGF